MQAERRRYDIGIVVPLPEELRSILTIAPVLDTFEIQGAHYYELDFGQVTAVCCLVGRMGPLPTAHVTSQLLQFTDVKVIVVLGLAGALDKDLSVGDVAVASEVNEFQANSKAEADGDEKFTTHYSGRHYPLNYRLREAISNFEFSGAKHYSEWLNDANRHFANVKFTEKEKVCATPAKTFIGPIASGNTVSASTAFAKELKGIDRKFIAIDMEAAGAALASAERTVPVPCLVIRGISDSADESKKELERTGKGEWRTYCVLNAASYLQHLLKWSEFRDACGLSSQFVLGNEYSVISTLTRRLESQVGGAWLAALIYDVYSHAPLLNKNDIVTPADINRAQIYDSALRATLQTGRIVRELLQREAISIEIAQERFVDALTRYRSERPQPEVHALLVSFDAVCLALIHPEEDNTEVMRQLSAVDDIEETQGLDGVLAFLREIRPLKHPLRERFVDALDRAMLWQDVIAELTGVPPSSMTRMELEHYIYACSRTALHDAAFEAFVLYSSEHTDSAAQLFRIEAMRKFPFLSIASSGEGR